MSIMYCPSCHKQVQSTFAKCPYCSRSFSKQNVHKPTISQDSSILKKIKKFVLIVIGTLSLLFILFFVWAINSTPSSSSNSSSPTTNNYKPEEYTSPTQNNETKITAVEEPKTYAEVEEKPDFMNAENRLDIPPQYRDALEPIDDDAILDKDVSQDDFLLGLSAIRAQGYNCKSISSVALMYGGGVRYTCNNFSKQYEVTKEDGVFQVEDKS